MVAAAQEEVVTSLPTNDAELAQADHFLRRTPANPYSAAVKAGGFIYLSGALAGIPTLLQTLAARPAHARADEGRAARRRLIARRRRRGDGLPDLGLRLPGDEPGACRAFWPGDPPTRTTVITTLVVPDARVEISMVACRAAASAWCCCRMAGSVTQSLQLCNSHRRTVFLSGLVARRGSDNTFVGGDVRVQTRTIMENAGELLAAAGLTFATWSARDLSDPRGRLRGDERGLSRVLPGRAARARPCNPAWPARSGRGDHVRRLIRRAEGDRDAAVGLAAQSRDSRRPAPVRFGDARQHPDTGRRRRRADARDALQDRRHAPRRRRVARRCRRRARLHHRCHVVRHDERRIPRVLRRRFPRGRPWSRRSSPRMDSSRSW